MSGVEGGAQQSIQRVGPVRLDHVDRHLPCELLSLGHMFGWLLNRLSWSGRIWPGRQMTWTPELWRSCSTCDASSTSRQMTALHLMPATLVIERASPGVKC